MGLQELQKSAVQEVELAFARAEKHYKRSFIYNKIEFSNRLTTTAGLARLSKREIVLSNKLMLQNTKTFIKRTPAHEAAHIIAYQIDKHRGKGHGPLWKEVMSVVGQEPSVYHSMATPGEARYVSKCGTEKTLTKIRHGKLQRGTVNYYMWKDGVKVTKEDWVK